MIIIKKITLISVLSLLLTNIIIASNYNDQWLNKNFNEKGFTENRGQIVDQNAKPNPAVMYLLNGNGLNIQVKQSGFSYDIFTIERKSKDVLGKAKLIHKLPGKDIPKEEITYHFHRIDITLLGSNPKAQVIAEGKSDDYTNCYNVEHAPDGILHVHQYQKITYKEIYPGIDIEYLYTEKGFKYNFVVHAGANLSDIRLQYKGAPFKASGQTLIFNTSQGEFKESIPASWLIKNGSNQTVEVNYFLINEQTIGFNCKQDISGFDLVVDPNPDRLWGTYYGGLSADYCQSSATDSIGNVYLTGFTKSITNIATSGSHQISFSGREYDAFLVKFNSSGVRQWGTYYGGADEDIGASVITHGPGNVYLAGSTYSTANISTSGSHQASFGGGSRDAFLIKFNASGARLWGTYYGGMANDYAHSVKTDGVGNVFLAGTTFSTSNIATSGSHQTILMNSENNPDAFLVKFNNNGMRQWGTYYGGTVADEAESVTTDGSGNVYLAGYTFSTSNIATSGSHQISLGGSRDAFLVKFNNNGMRQWGTYYGGNNQDHGVSITTDLLGNVYLAGGTSSTTNISTSGSHQPIYGGGWDGFLVKFNTNGIRQWGTYYGGTVADGFSSIATDGLDNVYLAGGTTGSTNNISTSGSYQPNFGGITDAILVKFNNNGIRQWGTYYGGSGDENYISISVYGYDNIYMSGTTAGSSSAISSGGSHQALIGGSYDAFLVKFKQCSSTGILGSIGTISSPSSNYCSGSSYTFSLSNPTSNSTGYWWRLPPGWVILSGQNTTSINVIAGVTGGTISVKAYNNCNDSTPSNQLNINISSPPQPGAITGSTNICAGSSLVYSVPQVSGATSYLWLSPPGWIGGSNTNSINLTFNNISDTLRVKAIGSGGCLSEEQKLYISILSPPKKPNIIGPNQVIPFSNNNYNATSNDVQSYEWIVTAGWNILLGQGTANATIYSGNQPAVITVNIKNNCGSNSESISVNLTSSLDKKQFFRNLSIYPIPTIDVLTIDYQLSNLDVMQWQVYSITGQSLLSGILSGSNNKETIALNGLGSGVYVIEFMDKSGNAYKHKFNVLRH